MVSKKISQLSDTAIRCALAIGGKPTHDKEKFYIYKTKREFLLLNVPVGEAIMEIYGVFDGVYGSDNVILRKVFIKTIDKSYDTNEKFVAFFQRHKEDLQKKGITLSIA